MPKIRAMNVHQVFQEFADTTSMHGIPRIINARSITARIFWSIICIGAFVMFFWQCGSLLQRYYSYPKKVNMEIVQKPVPFPSVSICNVDHLDMIYVARLNRYLREENGNGTMDKSDNETHLDSEEIDTFLKDYVELRDNTTNFLGVYQNIFGLDSIDNIMEAMSRLGLVANMNYSIISKAGVKREDFIVSCRFMDGKCNISQHFRQIYDPYYFNCFLFDPSAESFHNKMSRLQGIEYGLSVLLFTGSAGQLKKPKTSDVAVWPGVEESDSALAAGKGSRVVIHAAGTRPFPTAEGFDVPPGFSVTIGVKARENERITPPHGNCTTNEELKGDFNYTLISCQNECIQRSIMRKCGCVDSRISIPSNRMGLGYCFQIPPLDKRCFELVMVKMLSDSNETFINEPLPDSNPGSYPGMDTPYDDNDFAGEYGNNEYYDVDPIVLMVQNMTEDEQNELRLKCEAKVKKWHKMMECRQEVYSNMTMGKDLSTALDHCECWPPCNDIVYDATYSLSTMPDNVEEHAAFYVLLEPFIKNLSPSKKKVLADRYNNDNIRNGIMRQISRLNVHIADSNIIKTTEAADYEAIRLVSDIGGQLGLWIGISVITLFEVLQLIADVLRFLASKGRHISEKKSEGKMANKKPYGNGARYVQGPMDIEYPCEFEKLTTV